MEIYKIMKNCLSPVFGRMYDISIKGKENVPKRGAILAANHSSYLDPFLICYAFDEKIHFLVKNSFNVIPIKYFLKSTGQIFVAENSLKYIRNALKILLDDGIVGIFPEGQRSKNGRLLNGKSGIANLSYHSNAPIVPIAIIGAHETFPRGAFLPKIKKNIEIKIGKPIYFWENKQKTKETCRELADLVMKEISLLM